jgi:hypothetical protein
MLLECSVTSSIRVLLKSRWAAGGSLLAERETFPAIPIPFATRHRALRASLLTQRTRTGDLVFPVKRGTQADEIIYQP